MRGVFGGIVLILRLISFAMLILRLSYMLAPYVGRLREFIAAALSRPPARVDRPIPWPVRSDNQAPWQVFNDSMADQGQGGRSDDAERG